MTDSKAVTNTLNQIAKELGISDKNVVISVAIKGLIDLGASPLDAAKMILGEDLEKVVADRLFAKFNS